MISLPVVKQTRQHLPGVPKPRLEELGVCRNRTGSNSTPIYTPVTTQPGLVQATLLSPLEHAKGDNDSPDRPFVCRLWKTASELVKEREWRKATAQRPLGFNKDRNGRRALPATWL
jgi:hypothetical protein